MSMKKRLLAALILGVLLLSPAVPAQAADSFSFWVSPDGEKSAEAIQWYKAERDYYRFLPGNVDVASLRIGYEGSKSASLNGRAIAQGDSAAILQPGTHCQIKAKSTLYNLHIMQGSPDLPALYITTESGSLNKIHQKKTNKEAGYLVFVNGAGQVEYAGNLTHIKMRGNSSTTFAKKNYQIKLEKGTNLCGMGKCRTWILTGNYRDKSLLRNQITMDMAYYAGLSNTPEHLSAELYINNEYMGLYMFSEKVMIDDDRIDISDLEAETEALNERDLSEYPRTGPVEPAPGKYKAYEIPVNPADITGGYLIEFEAYSSRYKEEASVYHTNHKSTLVIKSPEYCSEKQMAYISAYMQSFENAIFAENGVDPDTGRHYTQLMDMDSLVTKYLVEEVCKNYDGNSSSMFFYKPSDSQSTVAFAGPVWDYDSAYGSYAREDNADRVLSGSGLWIANEQGNKYWWPALYKQPDFYQAVTEKYESAFLPAMQILLGQREGGDTLRSLEEYADEIRLSTDMNLIRWPRAKKPNTVAQTGYTFDENVDFLKSFISERMQFLNDLWLGDH